MAKKQNKISNNGVDPRIINSQLNNEREKLIQQGKSNNFSIKFMNKMFIVKDELSKETPIAFSTNRTLVSTYTMPVINYMEKVRHK
jgi:hypothetical protein